VATLSPLTTITPLLIFATDALKRGRILALSIFLIFELDIPLSHEYGSSRDTHRSESLAERVGTGTEFVRNSKLILLLQFVFNRIFYFFPTYRLNPLRCFFNLIHEILKFLPTSSSLPPHFILGFRYSSSYSIFHIKLSILTFELLLQLNQHHLQHLPHLPHLPHLTTFIARTA
jgi:hypothetical protein